MFYGALTASGPPAGSSINLQATLSACTASGEYTVTPHHPITCSDGHLALHDDGTLECGHARTADNRVQDAIQSSVAILLFEMVFDRYGSTPRVETHT